MAERVVLHIGAMKSGTSFIQAVLDANRAALAEHDVHYACPRWRLQVLAVRELAEKGGARQEPLPEDGYWARMVREIDERPGTSVVSMEFLGPRRKQKIEVVQEAFAGADLQVVLTARDLARSIPAMWTESMQNRGVRTWEEFLDAVRTDDGSKPARWFWGHQRLAEVAERWTEVVGREHFTLVTVPPKGAPPSLLWDRFAEVAGIPAGVCDLEVARTNPGIDAASAMVLRELNVRLAEAGITRWQYERLVKGILAKRGLVRRGRDSMPLGIDERWVRKQSRADVDRLRELGVRVVGDLDDLTATKVPGVHTRKVGADQQLDAALDGLAFLITTMKERLAATPADDPADITLADEGDGPPEEGDAVAGAEPEGSPEESPAATRPAAPGQAR